MSLEDVRNDLIELLKPVLIGFTKNAYVSRAEGMHIISVIHTVHSALEWLLNGNEDIRGHLIDYVPIE